MILADTSVWLDHLRRPDMHLSRLLAKESVLMHPMVIGEIAMGSVSRRQAKLKALLQLPQAVTAYHEEVLHFVEERKLWGLGIGYVDAHLLVSTKLTAQSVLWTRDKRLQSAAELLDLAWPEPMLS